MQVIITYLHNYVVESLLKNKKETCDITSITSFSQRVRELNAMRRASVSGGRGGRSRRGVRGERAGRAVRAGDPAWRDDTVQEPQRHTIPVHLIILCHVFIFTIIIRNHFA